MWWWWDGDSVVEWWGFNNKIIEYVELHDHLCEARWVVLLSSQKL